MCRDCAPEGGWQRRHFLTLAAAGLGVGLAAPASARPLAQVSSIQPAPLEILPRHAWAGDAAPAGSIPVEPDVRFLVVHHTVNANDYAEADVVPLLRGIHRFHTGPKGWPDVAYNFVVDRFGRVWEARAGSLDGAVAGDATGGNQGFDQKCAFLGDHRTAAPSSQARQAMAGLLAFLADRHGVDTSPGSTVSFVSRGSNRHPAGTTVETATLTGHRTMSVTACPGDAAMSWVTEVLPAAVDAWRAPPATTTTTTTSTASTSPSTLPTSSTSTPATSTTGPDTPLAGAPARGAPADDPLPWLVGGGALAVIAGAVLRLRSRG